MCVTITAGKKSCFCFFSLISENKFGFHKPVVLSFIALKKHTVSICLSDCISVIII